MPQLIDDFHKPLYGLGAEEKPVTPPTTQVDKVISQPTEQETDYMTFLSPMIAGLISSIVVYGLARRYDVERDRALGIAVAFGGLTALGHGLSNWLHEKTEPIRKQQPAVEIATMVPAPALPPATVPPV